MEGPFGWLFGLQMQRSHWGPCQTDVTLFQFLWPEVWTRSGHTDFHTRPVHTSFSFGALEACTLEGCR